MERANNDVAHYICTLAQGRANVWAQVGHTKKLTTLGLAKQHVIATQCHCSKLAWSKFASADARLQP
eukprot:3752224-Amphidinium_carterae.1